jgi:uridine kinase
MECIVIGIAGGTGSGKSTFTNRLKMEFNDKVTVIYHDNYYRCRDGLTMEKRNKINYDHPEALETDLLIKDLEKLKKGQPIDCPVYDFSQHNRSVKTIHILPNRVILLEGILVLADERLIDLLDMKIFVDADADERVLRRVIRDVNERGRDIEGIAEQYLTTVKPMHYVFVEPTKYVADIIINSGMNDIAFTVIKNYIADFLRKSEGKNE